MNRNLIIAHGGGPTAVINSSLYGVIKAAEKSSEIDRIIGAAHGVEGILSEHFIDLSAAPRREIDLLPQTPASAIGSCRRKLTEEDYPIILDVFKKHDIRYFICNGGNDSMDTCNKVSKMAKEAGYELSVMGIPKTIDNDLAHTDHSPGFGSAARFYISAVRDMWAEVKALPLFVTFFETMGRNAGWLAASTSLAKQNGRSCAQLIYLPEIPFDKHRFISDIQAQLKKGRELLVVVSEGISNPDGTMLAATGFVDGFGHRTPGGAAQAMARILTEETGIWARGERPGLMGRASQILQSPVDRDEAIACGEYAVNALLDGKSGYMVSLVRKSNSPYICELGLTPLSDVANVERKFPMEWITPDKTGISPEFEEYLKPLIGGEFPDYTDFDTYYRL